MLITRFTRVTPDYVAKSVPQMPVVPVAKWFQSVYLVSVLQRLPEIKVQITSTLGRIHKMDSTKKKTRRLAGDACGTASWCTNFGNDNGEVLMSVMTGSERMGINNMCNGIQSRYTKAGVNPLTLMYVDRDCCGANCVSGLRCVMEGKDRFQVGHVMKC